MIPHSYNFDAQMRMSAGIGGEKDTGNFILSRFPNAVKIERAGQSDDRKGTDWWITMQSGEVESLDLKARKRDYAKNNPNKDDLALEVWSVLNKKIGWTRDTSKRTNWIMWKWADTGRYVLIPFPWLCSTFTEKWQAWCEAYEAPIQNTVSAKGILLWQSQCVYVPRLVVWREIYNTFGGAPARQVTAHPSKQVEQECQKRAETRQYYRPKQATLWGLQV